MKMQKLVWIARSLLGNVFVIPLSSFIFPFREDEPDNQTVRRSLIMELPTTCNIIIANSRVPTADELRELYFQMETAKVESQVMAL